MGVKIAICLPTNRGLKPKTMQSLMEMIAYKPYDYEVFVSTKGFNTAENRTWLAVQAVKAGCTHLFWCDDDMIYPKDTLERLLSHEKDIVGAKYANRRGDGDVIEYLDDQKSDTELYEVKALGGGCVLTTAKVFQNVPQPWFWYKIADSGMVTMSHDWYFCEKARENGLKVWCDPHVKPGHIGTKEYV